MNAIKAQKARVLREIEILWAMVERMAPENISEPIAGFDQAVEATSRAFGIAVFAIRGSSREYRIMEARQGAMMAIRVAYGATCRAIANYWGLKDHATAIHAVKVAMGRWDVDMVYREKLNQVEEQLCQKEISKKS